MFNDEVIRPLDRPLVAGDSLAVLRGNLAPNGAVIKPPSAEAQLHRHQGKAVVFDSYDEMAARIDDPDLDVDASSVLVLRNAGPLGAPGMPEWGQLPIPQKLLQQGVRDMLRISDARMSGTSYGACVLHVAPESFVGGPLALVAEGDVIELDIPARRLTLQVGDEELARRRAAWRQPPPAVRARLRRHVRPAHHPGGPGLRLRLSGARRADARSRDPLNDHRRNETPWTCPPTTSSARSRPGRSQIGLWCSLASNVSVEIVAGSGFDWLLLDTEHSPNELPMVYSQLQAVMENRVQPIVRPPWNDQVMIKRFLDAGVQTLLIPMIQTVEEAQQAVASTRYPPRGVRGFASASRSSRFGRVKDYHTRCEEEICVLVQIETKLGLDNLEAIAGVDGRRRRVHRPRRPLGRPGLSRRPGQPGDGPRADRRRDRAASRLPARRRAS